MISPLKWGTMLLRRTPSLPTREEATQMKALPPRLMAAPVRKSTCPPVPDICLSPALSELTWP